MSKFNRFLNSRWFYRLTALVLAILLVAYVTSFTSNDTKNSATSRVSSLTSTKTKTVSVPLQVNVNSNKYFVTGYPENVKVKVTGPAALVTATTNTQNFTISADLSGLGVGKHNVKLTATGLNKELSYQIEPKSINVTIAHRKTITMPVHVKYDASNLASGYQLGTPTTSVTKVKVTGATDEVNQVSQVVAPINLTKSSTTDVNENVQLEAQDALGRTVNVVMTPAMATVKIPINSDESSKKVSIDFQPKNAADGRSYTITSDVNSLIAYGTKSAISKLKNSVVASVDVSGLPLGTTKQQVTLAPTISGIRSYSVSTADVTIRVTESTDGESTNASSASSAASVSSSDSAGTSSSTSSSASESSAASSSSDNGS
ncbi:CdaR family protein [Furfurilactobacillus entadae]|uniref:CdaR family protein n=1 Tax=Furfurilactobacillus entadae TaxID=2922307 RepID=UPI0035E7E06D